MRYCEFCGASELSTTAEIVPVCIDHSMDTELCRPCIAKARAEIDIEVLDD